MRIDVNKSDYVQIVCNKKIIAEIVIGDVMHGSALVKEVEDCRIGTAALKILAGVNDWQGFVDGVRGKTDEYLGDLEPELFPGVCPSPYKTHQENMLYQDSLERGRSIKRALDERI